MCAKAEHELREKQESRFSVRRRDSRVNVAVREAVAGDGLEGWEGGRGRWDAVELDYAWRGEGKLPDFQADLGRQTRKQAEALGCHCKASRKDTESTIGRRDVGAGFRLFAFQPEALLCGLRRHILASP